MTAGLTCFAVLRLGPQRLARYLTRNNSASSKNGTTPFQQLKQPYHQPSKPAYYAWLVTDLALSTCLAGCWGLVYADKQAIADRIANLPNTTTDDDDSIIDCHVALRSWRELCEMADFPIENPIHPSLEPARQLSLNCAKKIGSTDPYWQQELPEASVWGDNEAQLMGDDECVFRKE